MLSSRLMANGPAATVSAPAPDSGVRQDARARALAVASPVFAAVLVCALVVVGIATSRSAGMIAALWPAAGVGVVAWLRAPRSAAFDWTYGLLLSAAYGVGNLLVGNPLPLTLMFIVANMLEVLAAVALFRRLGSRIDFRSVRGFTWFTLAVPVLAPLPGALFAATFLNSMVGDDFLSMFGTWWFGHALGFAVIAPVGLTLSRAELARWRSPRRMAEAALLLGAVVVAGLLVFGQTQTPAPFVLTPLLILAAARLRLLGTGVAIVLLSTICIGAALMGLGPIQVPGGDVEQNVRLTQLFMIMGCMPAMLVAVLLAERDDFAAAARSDQAKAERASEGKSRLLANVSHEIKSPISGVIGIGDLWRAGKLGPLTETQKEMSEMLVRTARQIEVLAHDLLDVARAESGAVAVDLRPVEVGGLLEDLRRSTALIPEAVGLRLVIDKPEGRLLAHADSVRLSQVLTNLATNAVKYGASGGLITFRATRPSADRVRLEVIDLGPGLTPEKQAQLFEPFNRLGMERSAVEGHGIGLALAKRLVELQGGRIGVASAPGQGAAFWVELRAA